MQLLGKFAALAGSLPAQGRVRAAGQMLVGRPPATAGTVAGLAGSPPAQDRVRAAGQVLVGRLPATAVTTYYAYCICYFFKNLSRYCVGCID